MADPKIDVKGVDSNEGNTSVFVEKNAMRHDRDFEIIKGTIVISGKPVNDSSKTHDSWQAACDKWTDSQKSKHSEDEIISLSCGEPTVKPYDKYRFISTSTASYEMKVRIRDKH